MGYPIEIANSMPKQEPVPMRDPATRLVHWLIAAFSRRRRRAHKSDRPGQFAQGVDPRAGAIRSGDARRLDFDEIARGLR